MIIPLPGEFLGVGVVSERWDGGICNHDGLEVEAAVSNISAVAFSLRLASKNDLG